MKATILCNCGQTLRVSSRSTSKSFHCPKCAQLHTVNSSNLNGSNTRNLQSNRSDSVKGDDEGTIDVTLEKPPRPPRIPPIQKPPVALKRSKWHERSHVRWTAIAGGFLIAVCLVGLFLLSDSPFGNQVDVPHDTPLEVIHSYAKASDQHDGDRVVQCFTNALVTRYLGEVLLLQQRQLADYESSTSAEIQRQLAEHRAFYKRHSMDIHPRLIRRKLFLSGGDRKMLAEYISMLKTAPLGTRHPSVLDSILHEKNLIIEGRSAVGVVQVPYDTGVTVITYKFTRGILGGWSISDIDRKSKSLRMPK